MFILKLLIVLCVFGGAKVENASKSPIMPSRYCMGELLEVLPSQQCCTPDPFM